MLRFAATLSGTTVPRGGNMNQRTTRKVETTPAASAGSLRARTGSKITQQSAKGIRLFEA